MGYDEQIADDPKASAPELRRALQSALSEKRNLLRLVAALVEEAGGEVAVSNATLVRVEGKVQVHERPWDGAVAVRGS